MGNSFENILKFHGKQLVAREIAIRASETVLHSVSVGYSYLPT